MIMSRTESSMLDYQDGVRLQNQDLLIRVRHWQSSHAGSALHVRCKETVNILC